MQTHISVLRVLQQTVNIIFLFFRETRKLLKARKRSLVSSPVISLFISRARSFSVILCKSVPRNWSQAIDFTLTSTETTCMQTAIGPRTANISPCINMQIVRINRDVLYVESGWDTYTNDEDRAVILSPEGNVGTRTSFSCGMQTFLAQNTAEWEKLY